MIINKITTGFVVQKFDTDTGRCISQEFIAGDQVEWENQEGSSIEEDDISLYFPLDMKQP